jgi:hypothetical protein
VCFASESAIAGIADIHFNFNLDTLYIDFIFAQQFFRFFNGLKSYELHNLRCLALSEECGSPCDDIGQSSREEFWNKLEGALDMLSGLRELKVVIAVYRALGYYYPDVEEEDGIPDAVVDEFCPEASYQIELYDELPKEIRARSEAGDRLGHWKELNHDLGPATDWVEKRATLVYGWNRAPPAEYI